MCVYVCLCLSNVAYLTLVGPNKIPLSQPQCRCAGPALNENERSPGVQLLLGYIYSMFRSQSDMTRRCLLQQQLLQHLLLPLQLQQLQYLDWRVEERVGGRREWEGGERERESVRERERGRERERDRDRDRGRGR